MPTETRIDERDSEIVRERLARIENLRGPRVGDYVRFADGVERRVSYVWEWEPESVQTSDGGSFYLGNGYVSFSGSLHAGVHPSTLRLTTEVRDGSCWIFHHDYHTAGNGLDLNLLCWRVYECSEEATR